MNKVDVVLLVLLLFYAVRGFTRGFFRELFGLAAVIGGIIGAILFTEAVSMELAPRLDLPESTRTALAFVGTFVVIHTFANLIGYLLDRVTQGIILRWASRLFGAALGAGKGSALLAFVLLFLHVFPVGGTLDRDIMDSELGRTLVSIAKSVVREGWREAPATAQPKQA